LIGRESPTTLNRKLTVLVAVLACIGNLALSASPTFAHKAAAPQVDRTVRAVVQFARDGQTTLVETTTKTVAAFLTEQGIVLAPEDFLSVDPQSAITNNMELTYRTANTLTLVVATDTHALRSSALTVADLLNEQNITLGPQDRVTPALTETLSDGSVVHVHRIYTWTERVRQAFSPPVIQHLDLELGAHQTRILRKGAPGVRDLTIAYTNEDGIITKKVVAKQVLRKPKTRIVARGFAEYAHYSSLTARAASESMKIAGSVMSMVATAYTAGCAGCSGYTKLGYHAGHGIVAVDPRFIPLGARLYIPGYGKAIAGDTGGAIRGNRIDLGFDSWADAMRFGRRVVQVFVLR
jgi:uncharacterized protein YabE (DUF348 family)